MLLRDFLFTMIMITVVVFGFSSFWGSLASSYNTPLPADAQSGSALIQMYNMTDDISGITYQLQGNATGIAAVIQNIPILGGFASLLIAGMQAIIVMVTDVPQIFISMLSNVSSLSGGFIPSWFIGLVGAAIILVILWAVISQTIVKGRV